MSETQKPPNRQNNLKKDKQSGRNHASWLQSILQRYGNENYGNGIQTDRTAEHDREPRNNPGTYG